MRREEIPLQKVTLSLYKGDFDRLREFKPRLGASKVVRLLVRNYINAVEKRVEQRLPRSEIYEEDAESISPTQL